MDEFRDYISLVLEGVHISKRQRIELEEELYEHLTLLKKQFIADGYTDEQSAKLALENFGDTKNINMEFKKVHTFYSKVKYSFFSNDVFKESIRWTATVAGALIISLSLRSYVFASAQVRQHSMEDTLYEGQRVVENKLKYYYSTPERGDIVIINNKIEVDNTNKLVSQGKELIEGFYNDNSDRLIKRVIGVPGDTIEIREGKVYLNGKVYEEPYAKGYTYPKTMFFPIVIPKGEYCVMGDNRENSMDSRDIGLIPKYKIEGIAEVRIWPLDKVGNINK